MADSFPLTLGSYAPSKGGWIRVTLESEDVLENAESVHAWVRQLFGALLSQCDLYNQGIWFSPVSRPDFLTGGKEWKWRPSDLLAQLKGRHEVTDLVITSALGFHRIALLTLPVIIRDSREVPKPSVAFFFKHRKMISIQKCLLHDTKETICTCLDITQLQKHLVISLVNKNF